MRKKISIFNSKTVYVIFIEKVRRERGRERERERRETGGGGMEDDPFKVTH